jgi:hypothetical protein
VRELFGLDDAGACFTHPAFGEQPREERG